MPRKQYKRVIKGKNYWGGYWYKSKVDAKAHADELRKKGERAMVVKSILPIGPYTKGKSKAWRSGYRVYRSKKGVPARIIRK